MSMIDKILHCESGVCSDCKIVFNEKQNYNETVICDLHRAELDKKVTRSQASGTDHECDEDGEVDCDICAHCGEHSSFCSVCGMNNCCNEREMSA